MNSTDEILRYKALNKLARRNATVIFGGSADCDIPVNELKQYYELEDIIYNRSIRNLTAQDAAQAYADCVSELEPSRVIIHIGEEDAGSIENDAAFFDKSMMNLVSAVRENNARCDVIIASQCGNDEMNRHLKHIADSCRCVYADIMSGAFSPSAAREALSFLSSLGILRGRDDRASGNNLARIMLGYEKVLA